MRCHVAYRPYQGRVPVLFVADPGDHASLGDRDRVGKTQLRPQRCEVVEELSGGAGTVGAHQNLLPDPRQPANTPVVGPSVAYRVIPFRYYQDPICVRPAPDHLILDTQRENMLDRAAV